jgi:hypothetical protein
MYCAADACSDFVSPCSSSSGWRWRVRSLLFCSSLVSAEETLCSGVGFTGSSLQCPSPPSVVFLSIVFSCLTAAIQLLTTGLIIYVLLRHQRQLNKAELGGRSRMYSALATLLIESALLYTVSAVLYVVLTFVGERNMSVSMASIAVQTAQECLVVRAQDARAAWADDSYSS